jgi:phage-related protein
LAHRFALIAYAKFGMKAAMKELEFCGSSLDDLTAFPQDAKRDAGFQLRKVQKGEDPDDWKPMKTIGPGVREIRISDDGQAFRVIYVASKGDRVFVLHAFEKKTQQTSKRDIDLARARFKAL